MKLTPSIIHALASIVGLEHIKTDEVSLALYGYDCSLSRTRPDGIVLIQQPEQIAPLLQILSRHHIAFVPRASATNHAGSCTALRGGIILNLTCLNRILEINTKVGYAVVEPGVVTGDLQAALHPLGFFYAPDPASQAVSTIGGNLAQNASGARCMKYGGTIEHVLEISVVLPDGTKQTLSRSAGGPDLIGIFAGSEGTLGVITKIKVQILPLPKHIHTFLVTFSTLADSVKTVSDLVAHGIIPRCVEAMDKLTTQTVEAFAQAGYPTGAEALLILELDGTPAHIKQESAVLEDICGHHHCLHIQAARTEEERAKLWRGRQSAYAAMARLAPNVIVGDGTVPRSELPRALEKVQKLLAAHKVRASLLFHAGDGNFHPQILCDQRNKLEVQHVSRVVREILQVCVHCGGTISGEHGVGVEKRALMAAQYEIDTLDTMARVKHAVDPYSLANPLKILPYQFQEKARPLLPLPNEIKALQDQQEQYQAKHTPYVIVGKNTSLKTNYQHILTAGALTKLLEIDTQNYTATAQAGISLTALISALKKAKVYMALPEGKGTLGGAFCSGRFPGFYAHVTAVEALRPDGAYVRYGGKFMKNAAGYPLTRLWAGSQGTMGLVTQLTFKIFAFPVPALKPLPFTLAPDNVLWSRLRSAFNHTQLLLNTARERRHD